MHQFAARALLLVICMLPAAAPLLAQTQVPPPAPQTPQSDAERLLQDSDGARATRARLQQLLRQYPPAVGEVLQRDPSLMNRPDYLAPYPTLAAFLQQHPEIARNPSFFLGGYQFYEERPRDRAFETFQVLLAGIGLLAAGAAFLSVFVWVVRSVIDHRRWLRLSRVQAEVHTKLLDRLTTNEDLLAYIQTPAGRRFLESAPISLEGEPRASSAPLSRIVWSLQAGIVLASLGIGFWFVQNRIDEEVAEGFYVIGTIAMALGAGFAVSAVIAYVISSRLGLVAAPRALSHD
jgi:hypothetical protein